MSTMRTALRWLCYTILVSIVVVMLIGQYLKHGWESIAFMAVLIAAVLGALKL